MPSAELPSLVSAEDEAAQASYVADHVLEYREAGIALKRQAVLFRAAHHSDLLEVELGRRNIPFEILSRWWLVEKILACLTATGASPALFNAGGKR
jgi:superfamily I DNA/RNA helicase